MNLTVTLQRHYGNATQRVQDPAATSFRWYSPTPTSPLVNQSRGSRPPYRMRGQPVSPFNRDRTTTATWSLPPPTFGKQDATTSGMGGASNSSTIPGGGGLPPMAVHFVIVGALFAAVVVLALVNAYLHFRSQRRRLAHRRAYVATPEERFASQRRRRSRRGRGPAAEDESAPRRSTGMSVRMKPTKMFA